ncbi:MAG TPA: SDR family NAD(P)-dependent oxidoreductase, partial [Mycobacteriales bacterium]|nr:SDR family NAD(P)-dependent oxidoreductase [Mycobacteriales bacterium]
MRGLTGKVAVVTGAASGIGAESARRLAEEGAHVVVADLADDAGRAVASEVDGLYVRTDVTSAAEVEALYATAAAEFGHVDVLVNNAGIGTAVP